MKLTQSSSMFFSCEIKFYFPCLNVISTFIQTIALSQWFFLCCQCYSLNINYLLLKFNCVNFSFDCTTYFISSAWKKSREPRHKGCQRWIPSHPLVKSNLINVNGLIILKVILVCSSLTHHGLLLFTVHSHDRV